MATTGEAESNFRFTSVFRDAIVWLFLNRQGYSRGLSFCFLQSRPLDFGPPNANTPRHVDSANSVCEAFDAFYDENWLPSRHFLHAPASTTTLATITRPKQPTWRLAVRPPDSANTFLSSDGLFGNHSPGLAVAKKPLDATAVLFGLKFADNIHYKFNSSQTS